MLNFKIFLNKFFIIGILLMSYSGYYKWIPIPFDPFIIFFALVMLGIFFNILKNNFNKNIFIITSILFIFFLWSYMTSLWGVSEKYYIEKIEKTLVLFICFVSPFFILKTKNEINFFINIFHFFCFIITIIIIIIFITFGDISFLLNQNIDNSFKNIPDYLALGTLLSSGFILSFRNNSKFWILYRILIFLSIILLAPRGPLILLILFTIIAYIFVINGKFITSSNIILIILSIFSLSITFTFTNRLYDRFNDISDNSSTAYTSVGSRLELYGYALKYFFESPFFGIGFGSFGYRYTGFEDRIEPHNIFFEIITETGLIGLLLFCFFLYIAFYVIYYKKHLFNKTIKILILITLYLFCQTLFSTYLVDSKDFFLWIGILLSYNKILKNNKSYIDET